MPFLLSVASMLCHDALPALSPWIPTFYPKTDSKDVFFFSFFFFLISALASDVFTQRRAQRMVPTPKVVLMLL